jgi:N-acetyl-gamma-glutamylphosphate reductase
MVRILNPSNLHIAFGLANIQEDNVTALRRIAKAGSVPTRLAIGPLNPHEKGPLFQYRGYHQAK